MAMRRNFGSWWASWASVYGGRRNARPDLYEIHGYGAVGGYSVRGGKDRGMDGVNLPLQL